MESSDPYYIVMLYHYSGVHIYEEPNREQKLRRELLLAVPVFVTQDKALAERYTSTGPVLPEDVYEIIQLPMPIDMILPIIHGFNERRMVK